MKHVDLHAGSPLADTSGGERNPAHGLQKTLGVFAVMASAVAAEYGSGVNTILSSALGVHPDVTYLLPLAVIVAGLVLLPSVLLYARFAQVISSAGSAYVWITTSLGPLTGFVVGFVYFVGVLGSMGFLAYIFATFLSTFLQDIGAATAAAWCLTSTGKFITGTALIGLTLSIHLRGTRQYGRIISMLFVAVVIAALTTVAYGLSTPPQVVVAKVSAAVGHQILPPLSETPSLQAFFAVVTLFVYLYGGISAAPSIGGESRNGGKTLATGLIRGWFVALILYAIVTFSLFHAVPWWVVHPAVSAGQSALMTIPGLIGIMAPLGISLMYKALVIVVGGKTMAPLMFDCSRNLYAWAVDEHVSSVFARTSSRRVPHVALVTVAALTVFFLGESVYGGFQIGVALRAISLVLVSVAVGVGALRITYSKVFEDTDLRRHLLAGKGLAITSILTIVFGVGLIYFGLYQSGVPLLLQPGVQGALAAVVAALIYALSRSKSGSSCR